VLATLHLHTKHWKQRKILETKEGNVQISMVNPMESMQVVQNPNLGEIAGEVSKRLNIVLENV